MTNSQLSSTSIVRAGYPSGKIVRCSLTDTGAARGVFSIVFFFARALDESRLRAGLAHALGHLPAFAGRLREAGDTLEIVCDDSGVPMTSAAPGLDLRQAITRMTQPRPDLIEHIDGKAAWSGQLPLLTVRVNQLTDGGTALGFTWHHAIGDLRSFLLLLRSWSAFVDGTTPPAVLLVENREDYLDGVLPATDCGRPGYRLMNPGEAERQWQAIGRAIQQTRNLQIYFTDLEVHRLRQAFTALAGRVLSANDVLSAHVVTTIQRFQDEPRTEHLSMPIDIRHRLNLPSGLVGNMTSDLRIPCPPEEAPPAIATGIRTGLDRFVVSHLNLRSTRDFLARHRSRLLECFPLGFDLARREFTMSNMKGAGLYDLTFGGQHPTYVSPTPSPFPWLGLLIEGFDKQGTICAVGVPQALADVLASPAGQAALHPCREPGETRPELAAATTML